MKFRDDLSVVDIRKSALNSTYIESNEYCHLSLQLCNGIRTFNDRTLNCLTWDDKCYLSVIANFWLNTISIDATPPNP